MDFFSSPLWYGTILAICIITFFNVFHFKKKIEKIGKIKCKRCGYQGKPKQWGNIFNTKIVCPDCKSEIWEKSTKIYWKTEKFILNEKKYLMHNHFIQRT